MSEIFSTVIDGGVEYSACKNGQVLITYIGTSRPVESRHINSVPLSVQQLFEADLVRQAKEGAQFPGCEEILAKESEPSIKERERLISALTERVTELESLLTQAKTPFAFVRDKTLYQRINSALGKRNG